MRFIYKHGITADQHEPTWLLDTVVVKTKNYTFARLILVQSSQGWLMLKTSKANRSRTRTSTFVLIGTPKWTSGWRTACGPISAQCKQLSSFMRRPILQIYVGSSNEICVSGPRKCYSGFPFWTFQTIDIQCPSSKLKRIDRSFCPINHLRKAAPYLLCLCNLRFRDATQDLKQCKAGAHTRPQKWLHDMLQRSQSR